jgi:hypothetical protein
MRRVLGMTGVAAALLLPACGDDGDPGPSATTSPTPSTTEAGAGDCQVDEGATTDPAATVVEVALGEYTIDAAPASVPAGPVAFRATNDGLVPHELMIVRWDGDPGAIPANVYGVVERDPLGDALRGRIRAVPLGETCSGTVTLEAGSYALVCSLVDDGTSPHYPQGMYATFTVT